MPAYKTVQKAKTTLKPHERKHAQNSNEPVFFDDPMCQYVRDVRKKMNVSQTQIGEWVGCVKANVSAWERGLHKPSYHQLIVLRDKSGLPLPDDKPNQVLKDMGLDYRRISDEHKKVASEIISLSRPKFEQIKTMLQALKMMPDVEENREERRNHERRTSPLLYNGTERRYNEDRRADYSSIQNRVHRKLASRGYM